MHFAFFLAFLASFTINAYQLRPHLRPLRSALRAEELDIEVRRGEGGGLGLDVNEENTVAGNVGQPSLQLGDVIIAIDGVTLDGKSAGAALTPGASSYTFTVSRDSDAARLGLERVLLQLAAGQSADAAPMPGSSQPGLRTFDSLGAFGAKAQGVVEALEAAHAAADASPGRAAHELEGWWKLVLTSSERLAAGGLTGYGTAPFCRSASLSQYFDEESRQVQTIEVVACEYPSAEHQLVVLKGEYSVSAAEKTPEGEAEAPGEGGARPVVCERYGQLDYQGSPQIGSPPVVATWRASYLGQRLRVGRVRVSVGDEGEAEGEQLLVFERRDGSAQTEIEALLAEPVETAEAPRQPPAWERPVRDDGPDTDAGSMKP